MGMNADNIEYSNIISNEPIDLSKVEKAAEIIKGLQLDIKKFTENGFGPFVAAIYDEKQLVCWRVNGFDDEEPACWKNRNLFKAVAK